MPVPNKPTVVILFDSNNNVLRISNNIAPNLEVTYTRDPEQYKKESFGDPYEQVESNSFSGN